jgi:Xaa-Pro aminopeptidase
MQMEPEFTTLSDEERYRRHGLIRREMERRGLDCLIVTGFSSRWNEMNGNVRYVSNYADALSTVSYVVFPLKGDPTLLIQMTLKRSCEVLSWIKDIRPMSTWKAAEIFEERLRALGNDEGTVGLVGAELGVSLGRVSSGSNKRSGDVTRMPYDVYESLVRRLPKAKFTDATDMFTELRTTKSQEELKCMERSAELCDMAFEEMVRLAKPGIKERDWFAGVLSFAYQNGSEHPTFLIGASGPMPTSNPKMLKNDPLYSSRTIKKGDVIISEIGPKIAGYSAQSLQLISIGEPSRDVRRIAEHTVELYEKIGKELKPGRKVAEVIEIAQEWMHGAEKDLGDYVQSLTPLVHSIGLGQPDPTPVAMNELQLKPGMTHMIEIGTLADRAVYSWLGTSFEITQAGPNSLTRIPFSERALTVV